MLDELCLKNMFCGVIYGEEVKQRKPYPKIYEKSLINNRFKKSETIVIEDSYQGIKVGKTAEVFTVAIKDKRFGINQSDTNLIIDNFKDVIEYIKRVNSICS